MLVCFNDLEKEMMMLPLLMMIISINTQQHDLSDSSSLFQCTYFSLFFFFPPLLLFFTVSLRFFPSPSIYLSYSTGSIMGFRSRWPMARFIFIITKSISFTACRPTRAEELHIIHILLFLLLLLRIIWTSACVQPLCMHFLSVFPYFIYLEYLRLWICLCAECFFLRTTEKVHSLPLQRRFLIQQKFVSGDVREREREKKRGWSMEGGRRGTTQT